MLDINSEKQFWIEFKFKYLKKINIVFYKCIHSSYNLNLKDNSDCKLLVVNLDFQIWLVMSLFVVDSFLKFSIIHLTYSLTSYLVLLIMNSFHDRALKLRIICSLLIFR